MTADSSTPGFRVRLAKDSKPEGYRAFTLSRDDKPVFLDVQSRDGSGELVPYRAMLSVAYTALKTGAWVITLTAPGYAILVEGQHLGELVRRLKLGDVDAVHEFDPSQWPHPAEGTAVVTGLTLTTAEPR